MDKSFNHTVASDSSILTEHFSDKAQSNAHTEVFRNPAEYLTTVSTNFSRLSHNRDSLTLNDLQIDSKDPALSPQVREAASISMDHFKELVAMENESDWNRGGHKNLESKKVSFVRNLVADKFAIRHLEETGLPILGVAGAMAAAGRWYVCGASSIAADIGLGCTPMGVTAVGVGMIAGGAYLLYAEARDYNHLSNLGKSDNRQIEAWLK